MRGPADCCVGPFDGGVFDGGVFDDIGLLIGQEPDSDTGKS
jgi:hypothetical protein